MLGSKILSILTSKANIAFSTNYYPIYPLFKLNDFRHVSSTHLAFLANVYIMPEPTSFHQVGQHEGWIEAMHKELQALELMIHENLSHYLLVISPCLPNGSTKLSITLMVLLKDSRLD